MTRVFGIASVKVTAMNMLRLQALELCFCIRLETLLFCCVGVENMERLRKVEGFGSRFVLCSFNFRR